MLADEYNGPNGPDALVRASNISRMFTAPDTPTHKRKVRLHLDLDTDPDADADADADTDEPKPNRSPGANGVLQRSDAVAFTSSSSSYEDGETNERDRELEHEYEYELQSDHTRQRDPNQLANSSGGSHRPTRTETQLKAKVTMYEMEVQELRNMLKDATDRFSRQLIAERHKQQAQAAQLDLKFQDEFEQFEHHHRHELVQLQRDYDTRLARLNRELEAVRSSKATTCTAEAQTAMDGADVDANADGRWRAQLDAMNEEKLALQRVLSSVLRGFVRVKQALLPAAADSDLETCLARLSAAEDSCNAVIDEWTDELVAAIGTCDGGQLARPDSFWEVSLNRSNSIGPRLDASVSSVDSAEHEPHDADRLSRSVAELRASKRELEFRYESRELEFAKQIADRDSLLAERDTQIDAAQRQIRSLRTFVDELLVDREAERDEHSRRVAQLESALARRTGRRVDVDDLDDDVELQSDERSDPATRKRVADELDDEESLSDSESPNDGAAASDNPAAARKRSRRDAHAPLNSTMNEKQRSQNNADDDTIFPFEFDEVDAGNKASTPPSPKPLKAKHLEMSTGLYDELLVERNEEIAFLNRRIEQLNEEVAILKMDNEALLASERHDAVTQTDEATATNAPSANADRRPRLTSDNDADSNAECDDEPVVQHTHAAIARAFAAAPSNSLAHELANELGSDLLGDDPAADLLTLRTENDSLRLSVEALRTQLTDRSADLLAANTQLETLEAELEKMMQYNSSLTHDFDDVQSMLERQQTELERTQDEADERLKDAVRAVTDRYESLLASLKLGTHAARPAGPAVSETFNELEEEFYVLKERVRELTAQVDALNQQADVQRTEKEALDRSNAEMQSRNVALQQTIGRLEEAKAALQTCATQIQAENATLQDQLRVRNNVSSVQLGVQTDTEPAPPSIVSDSRVSVCTTHSAMQTTPPTVSLNTTSTQTDAEVQANPSANVAFKNSPAMQSVATQKDDDTTLDNMQRCEEQIRRLLTDWNNWQSAHSNAQPGQSDDDAANAKELKRRLDTEFERAAQLDAEMRSFLSWRVVTIDEERPDRTASQQYAATNSKQRDDFGSELLPLLRSKLQLADIDLLRILESVDYRLRQERLTSAELRESLDAERVRAIEIMSDLARERSHSMDLKLELQTARTKADDIASRLEAESLKRKQLESLLEKQRNENTLLQEHVANGLLQPDAGAGKPLALDRTRAERALRADLDTERQKRTLLEIELERSNSDLRTKRREFEELLRKQQTLERAKDDEIARLRNELQLAVVQKEAQVDELGHKLAETERQLTDANVQLRNHEALLREFKSRVEVQHEYALQLESTVQQLRSRLQSTLRSHNDEKASLLAQLEREKAASRRIHTQTTVFEQLTQASARLSLTDRNGEAVELFVDDLYKRLQRAEAHRRSLAYQKRYLSVLLNSFEQTEHATLAELARVTDALDDPSRATNGPSSFKRSNSVARPAELANGRTKYKFTRPFFRFRSGARVVIAAQRLNRMSKRWENVHCPVSLRALTNGGSSTPRDTNLLSAQSQLTSRRSSLAPLANGFDTRSPAMVDTRPRCSISNLSLTPAQNSLMTFR